MADFQLLTNAIVLLCLLGAVGRAQSTADDQAASRLTGTDASVKTETGDVDAASQPGSKGRKLEYLEKRNIRTLTMATPVKRPISTFLRLIQPIRDLFRGSW